MSSANNILSLLQYLSYLGAATWTEDADSVFSCQVPGQNAVTFEFVAPIIDGEEKHHLSALRVTIANVLHTWFEGSPLFEQASRLITEQFPSRKEWHESCQNRIRSYEQALTKLVKEKERA